MDMLKANSKKVLDIVAGQKKVNATQAYKDIHSGATDRTARSNAYKLMQKPESIIYLQKHTNKAISTIVELMEREHKGETRLRASQDVLDRTHGRAIQQVNTVTTGITLNIDLTSALTEVEQSK